MSTNYDIQTLERVIAWNNSVPIIPTVTESEIFTNNNNKNKNKKLELINYWSLPSHVFSLLKHTGLSMVKRYSCLLKNIHFTLKELKLPIQITLILARLSLKF